MLEFSVYAALSLGGFGIGLVLALLGSSSGFKWGSRRETSELTVAQTYHVRLELPSKALVVPEPTPPPVKEELVKCPCGLELAEAAMMDHVTVSGHSKPASSSGGTGKVWDLNEAVVETASPDCYKCGKPVHGLKRMGKTIYVAHLGCTDKQKPETTDAEEKAGRPAEQTQRAAVQIRITRCPICRNRVSEEDGFTEMLSGTGRTTRFHSACIEQVAG